MYIIRLFFLPVLIVFGWAADVKDVAVVVVFGSFASRLQRKAENLVSCLAAHLAAVQPQQKRSFFTIVNHTLKSQITKEEGS